MSTPVDKEVSLTRYETSDSGQLVTTASGRTVRLKPSGRLSMVTAWVLPHRAYAMMPSRAFMATLIAQDRAKSSMPNP